MSEERATAKEHARFQRVAGSFIRKGRLGEGAMMGHPRLVAKYDERRFAKRLEESLAFVDG